VSRNREADGRAPSAHDGKELVGTVIGGKYRVERVLGRGGMGTIYVAVQQPLGRRVALKVLHPTLGGVDADPEFQKRFLLEAATLSQLAHPNIVIVHDYGSLEGGEAACFMVMELLEGRTINQVLQDEGGRFDAPRALRITRDIARALRAAHDLGVVHRDLKPSNVMLCPGPEGEGEAVKVLDFGLVKVMRDDSEELTAEGRFLGSPRYMSPEQIQRMPMDGRSDLYSLGVILYRMLTGEVPFAGDHAVQTLMAHLSQPPPPFASYPGLRVPMAVEQIVMKLLSKSAADRYARAGELIRAIDAVWPQLSEEPLMGSGEHLRSLETSSISMVDLTPTTGSYPMLPLAERSQPAVVIQPPTPPEPAPAPSRPAWLLPVVVVVGLAAGLGGAAAVASLLEEPEPPPEPIAVDRPEPVAPPPTPPVVEPPPRAPDPVPTDPPVAAPTTFTLTIRSNPTGATVVRDGQELGQTPFTIELDRNALASAPAELTLRMAGRQPITITQGPSDANLVIERELPRLVRRPTTTTVREETPPPRTGADLSIKTAR
jgi:serine/threonine-protein kinase